MSFWQDARQAVRILRKAPWFTLASVVVLALGIGATTAIFSLVDAALLRPLPFREAHQLVMLFGVAPMDPLTFLTAPAVLTLVALPACLAPAVRALRADPIAALRSD